MKSKKTKNEKAEQTEQLQVAEQTNEQKLVRLLTKAAGNPKAIDILNKIAAADNTEQAKAVKIASRKLADNAAKSIEQCATLGVKPTHEIRRNALLYGQIYALAKSVYGDFAAAEKAKEDAVKAQIKAEREREREAQKRMIAAKIAPSTDVKQALEDLRNAYKQLTLYLRHIINISRSADVDGAIKKSCTIILNGLCDAFNVTLDPAASDNACAKFLKSLIESKQRFVSKDGLFVKFAKLPFAIEINTPNGIAEKRTYYTCSLATNEDVIKNIVNAHVCGALPTEPITPVNIDVTDTTNDVPQFYQVETAKVGKVESVKSVASLSTDICTMIQTEKIKRAIEANKKQAVKLADRQNDLQTLTVEPAETKTEAA